MDDIPGFAPVPPTSIRHEIAPEEWANSLKAWLTLARSFLRLPNLRFESSIQDQDTGLITFLDSYLREFSESPAPESWLAVEDARSLHKHAYLLCHRALSCSKVSPELLSWRFLAALCEVYHTASLQSLMSKLWSRHSPTLEQQIDVAKKDLVARFESGRVSQLHHTFLGLSRLIQALPQVGAAFATGSDLLDTLTNSFPALSTDLQQDITVFAYLSLISLGGIPKPNYSLLSDHLYTLRVNAKNLQRTKQFSLLSSMVSNTAFVDKLIAMSEISDLDGEQTPRALPALGLGLLEFQVTPARRHRASKGKKTLEAHPALEAAHIHRMAMISQIQDLFPDLGSGFVAKLLDTYDENIEIATSHLLEESLPVHLNLADRSEQLVAPDVISDSGMTQKVVSEQPSAEDMSRRRNVFQNDELDNLAVDTARLHIGKARPEATADEMLSMAKPNKAAILAALAQFDSDDDERDDTYDEADVGGTVDNSGDAESNATPDEEAEHMLFLQWRSDASAFNRDQRTRSSQIRATMKEQSGWTDEAIEGWAIILQRDARRQQQLQRRYDDAWQGQQNMLESTSWRAGHNDENDGPSRGRGRGRPQRGLSRGGRGSTSGPSHESGTQRARRGKEVRGSRGKKDGRAKKMARGMT